MHNWVTNDIQTEPIESQFQLFTNTTYTNGTDGPTGVGICFYQ